MLSVLLKSPLSRELVTFGSVEVAEDLWWLLIRSAPPRDARLLIRPSKPSAPLGTLGYCRQ